MPAGWSKDPVALAADAFSHREILPTSESFAKIEQIEKLLRRRFDPTGLPEEGVELDVRDAEPFGEGSSARRASASTCGRNDGHALHSRRGSIAVSEPGSTRYACAPSSTERTSWSSVPTK